MSRLSVLMENQRKRTGTEKPAPVVRPVPRDVCPKCGGAGTRPGKSVLLCRCQQGDAA